MLSKLCVPILALLVFVTTTCCVRASIATITPTISQTVQDSTRDGVFDALVGANGIFEVRDFTSSSVGPFAVRTIAEFPLASIALLSSADILSATLYLPINSIDSRLGTGELPPNIQVHAYVGDGAPAIADATLNNLIASSGAIPIAPVELSFDVTSFINSLVASGESFAGFQYRTIVEQSVALGGGGHRLEIKILDAPAAVPEPASVVAWGAIACLGGVVGYRRLA